MNVIVVKFNNGLEVVGEALSTTDDSMTMKNVFQVTYRFSEMNSPVISLTRLMMVADTEQFTFPLTEVFTASPVRKVILDYYHHACANFVEHTLPLLENTQPGNQQELSKEEMLLEYLRQMPVIREKMQ